MNLWVDDLRPAPDGWLWVKSSGEAIAALGRATFDVVSLDHDLGGDDATRDSVVGSAGRAVPPVPSTSQSDP